MLPAEEKDAVPSKRLRKWVASHNPTEKAQRLENEDVRYEAYASLLENRVRKAWVSLQSLLHYSNLCSQTSY